MILPREIEEVRAKIRQKVTELGADLLEIKYRRQGSSGTVAFIVDKEGGVTLQDCVDINRSLGIFFDEMAGPLIQGPYLLEVSSPGLDRPLVTERDFERTIGQVLRLTFRQDSGAVAAELGRVVGMNGGILIFEFSAGGQRLEIPISSVIKAVREIRFKK